jgi:hypothetical protein
LILPTLVLVVMVLDESVLEDSVLPFSTVVLVVMVPFLSGRVLLLPSLFPIDLETQNVGCLFWDHVVFLPAGLGGTVRGSERPSGARRDCPGL